MGRGNFCGKFGGNFRDCFGPSNTDKQRRKKSVQDPHRKKIFWGTFLASKQTFQAGGGYKDPIKTRKTHLYHRNLSSVAPFFSSEKSPSLAQGGVQNKGSKISGKILEHFREKFQGSKKITRANFVLQTCHPKRSQ